MADLEPWSWSRLNKIIKIYRLRGLEGWVGEVRGLCHPFKRLKGSEVRRKVMAEFKHKGLKRLV